LLVILAIVIGVNRFLIRRLRLPSATAKAGVLLVTAALLVAPALVML
jgi:hypothetical protein